MKASLSLRSILGRNGPGIDAAMQRGLQFLDRNSKAQLLKSVGKTIPSVPAFKAIDKSTLQDSYGGNQKGPSDDFLVGRGLFYLGEQRRLFLDCTSGHYQMTWGYGHPELSEAIEVAARKGVCWDNHSNIPQAPVKRLGEVLVEVANAPGQADPLDTVLLGVCTGSVACAAALKIQLKVFETTRGRKAKPVIISLAGNYHGSDMIPQFMRGMWGHMARPFKVVTIEPNDSTALNKAFQKHGDCVAGFWAEPILMNREAMALDGDYLRLAQDWCRKVGALMCIDEIQTGFWQPEVFEFRTLGLEPDLVVLGKGMSAGFHPLSGVLLRSGHDVLEQYDAISTNGSAAMPAYVALCSLELIRQQRPHLQAIKARIQSGFEALAAQFPGQVLSAQGRGYLSGLKFRRVDDALQFHRELLEAGVWARVHAYHAGHSTVLTKLGLLADEQVVDFGTRRVPETAAGQTEPERESRFPARVKTLPVGIIGGGLMGREFASATARWMHLLDMKVRPEIVALCDKTPAIHSWYRENFPSIQQFADDYRALLANPAVEVVYVAVPHHLHAEIYCAAIEAGKHLMGEKPFGIDLAANQLIIETARRNPQVFVRCSSESAFFPAMQKMADLIEQQAFGRILEVGTGFLHSSDMDPNKPINWKRLIQFNGEYGVLGDLGMHALHVPLRAGWRPRNVRAILSNIIKQRNDAQGRLVACDTWDNGTLLVETTDLTNGESFPWTLKLQRMAPGNRNTWYTEIFGTRASARWSSRNPQCLEVLRYEPGGPQEWRQIQAGYEPAFNTITGNIFEFGFGDSILQMWGAFVHEFTEGKPVRKFAGCVLPEETAISHSLFTAALESQKNSAVVSCPQQE